MISLGKCLFLGLAGWSLMACGSDDPAGGGAVDPADCAAVAAKEKSLASAAGCAAPTTDFQTACQTLHSLNKCTKEWAALINCISPRPASDFQCDTDNQVEPKAGVCAAEQDTFTTCAGG